MKTAIVTGSSRGIGRATVVKFAENGYNVVINCVKNEDKANRLKKDVEKKYGVQALVVKADVSKEKEVENMVKLSVKTFGKIDVLVNNAGIDMPCEYEDKTVDSFMKTLSVNLIGPFLMAKYVVPKMKKGGKIVNISSNNATKCFYPTSADYDASKAALINLTKNMAIAYAPDVNVNAVAPGWVDTDMNKDFDADMKKLESERILKKRFAKPEDIANVVYFLASDQADYITGEVITVDGGM